MARGNRQTTRTRIHISLPRPTENGDRRQQILCYWTNPRFISPEAKHMNSIPPKRNTAWLVASVFSLLYASNAGIADDKTSSTSTIRLQYYGREPGAQLEIRQPGVAEFRKGKPGRWDRPVVTRNIDPEKFRKLLAAMELFITTFPCGGYAPLKVSDPAFYTVSYTRNHFTEELALRGSTGQTLRWLERLTICWRVFTTVRWRVLIYRSFRCMP